VKSVRRIDAKKPQEQAEQIGWPGDRDLRVASHDQRVAVVTRVAPTPTSRFAEDHERGYLVEDAVHPIRLERGPVPRLVPARVGSRGIEHAVDHEGKQGPPSTP